MKLLRCAIYTRKSTEHGLEQEFNSLDNQREAAEAYIKSQAHEGWRLLPEAYDDGGVSGGSLDRPALQQLLAEVRAGRVDVIVVYKVDRLTRSLSDFAKLVELFDAHGVSFVSVTQAFNTTTSMGRLTLNVLLSFAQFEREVTGERIRDKIAASKKKGMRVGGPVPLGYFVQAKKLVRCPTEADQVRLIFTRYVELGCLRALAGELRERGIVTKISPRRDGSVPGGIPFTKGPLAYLLRNRVYVGEVIHKGRHYPGEHEPILEPELFEAVQQALSAKAASNGQTTLNRGSLLKGLIFDDRGNRMSPSTAKKGGARYRYYVSAALAQGRHEEAGSVARVPAPEVEDAVLRALGMDPSPARHTDAGLASEGLASIQRITMRQNSIEIRPRAAPGENTPEPIVVPWAPPPSRRRRQIIGTGVSQPARPIRAETRARLVQGVANARLWVEELVSGKVKDTYEIARRQGCSERSVRMTLNLAFLAPEIMQGAVDGTLSDRLGTSKLTEVPLAWSTQKQACELA